MSEETYERDYTQTQEAKGTSVNEARYAQDFTQPINRVGKATHFLAIFLSFLPAIWLWVYFGLFPGVGNILYGWFLCLATFGIYAIVEPISFFPTLGLPGTYMAFLSGNISNMRLPVSAIAQETVGVERGTKKAELVSTLGIAGSIVLNLVFVTVGALFGAAILGALPPVIVEAFGYVSPAIFGAMFFMFIGQSVRNGIFAVSVAFVLGLLGFIPSWGQILVTIFSTIAFAMWMYNREKAK